MIRHLLERGLITVLGVLYDRPDTFCATVQSELGDCTVLA
jgi:hypothetical protein